jgi:hypothetical protein
VKELSGISPALQRQSHEYILLTYGTALREFHEWDTPLP